MVSALRLLQKQGYASTGVSEIAREGHAPMGSFYHHFPGGKEELAVAAMTVGAQEFEALLSQALESSDDLAECLARIASDTADTLQLSSWERGCPVATTALETVFVSVELQRTAAEAFERWTDLIRARMSQAGYSADDAAELATTVLAMVEGAELLARVHRSTEPLALVANSLRRLTWQAAAGEPGSA
ncbi:TetR/AcrR family transcriptional regulator [Promicromonospora aerolata]|uniref:TetR/AcrR family transcriptional regulator n=1 Tax=Promicromonospora aerolata TaxID=195749 RepID=A0ABW4VGQ3_9MICO